MQSKKIQPYTYIAVSAAVNRFFYDGGYYVYLYLSPPEDALTIENIKTHIKFRYNQDIAEENQVLEQIGIINTPEVYDGADEGVPTATYKRYYTINETPDENGIIDLEIDLSKLLDKNNVERSTEESYFRGYANKGTFIFLKFNDALGTNFFFNYNNEESQSEGYLWKADAIFTIKGIR